MSDNHGQNSEGVYFVTYCYYISLYIQHDFTRSHPNNVSNYYCIQMKKNRITTIYGIQLRLAASKDLIAVRKVGRAQWYNCKIFIYGYI